MNSIGMRLRASRTSTPEERKRLEDLYESSLTLIKEKLIEGTVISIGKKEVVVNVVTNQRASLAHLN